MKPVHAGRLERYLGVDTIERLQGHMGARGKGPRWYGRPICLLDVPGSVWVTADGDFVGTFTRGSFMGGLETLVEFWQRAGRLQPGVLGSNFANVSQFLSQGSGGNAQRRSFLKVGGAGSATFSSSLWRVGAQPIGGAVSSAAPGGRALDKTTVGALAFVDTATNKNRLVGADGGASVANQTLLLYDRTFDVIKTMNSTATEAVTGVPTRYQSTTSSNEDYVGDSFLFIEVGGTVLAATGHNWTVCQYTNQAGTTGQSVPSVAGSSAAAVDRFDLPAQYWFAPLASGDTGIKALTQMQCSATVATGLINFVIGHPLGWMAFPVISTFFPFDWVTNRDPAPQVLDGACLAFINPVASTSSATTWTGRVVLTSTP